MNSSSLTSQFFANSSAADRPVWEAALLKLSGLLHLKTRYVLTRDNRLRLRYVASAVAGVALITGMYASGAIQPSKEDMNAVEMVAEIEPAAGISEAGPILSYVMNPQSAARHLFSEEALNVHRDKDGQIRRDPNVKQSVELAERSAESESPAAEERRIEIGKGDTLAGVLSDAGLEFSEAQDVVSQVSKYFNMKNLRPGQVFNITLEPADTDTGYQLAALTFAPDPLKTIEVSRDDNGDIISELSEKEIKKQREARQMVINGSVYSSADRADLPDRVTANAIKLFSYAVDFQRDIKSGDKLEVLYDSYKTPDGYVAKTGEIVFAKLKVGSREYALYRYESANGKVDYYTADGKSVRQSTGLMRTPVAYGRVSSGFGARVHPVLGYTKMHKGVDFASPVGTPIYASGDGAIERAGRFSSFGNYVRIRHSSKISTAYAHMSRFGKGIRPGMKVKQGQIIGYVGTTGRSTGPHLHYEVLVNNVQVNPSSVKFSTDNALQGNDLNNFKRNVRAMGEEYTQNVKPAVKLASAE
ncbi:MAG TPA: peptidase M23 [Rhodospirillaceae bacterium]|nr:peptidase M23 [Rhodospirillaceae bacterium]